MERPPLKTFKRHSSPDRAAGAALWVFPGGQRGIIKLRLPTGEGKATTIEFEPGTARSVIDVLNLAIRDWEGEFGSDFSR